MPYTCKVCKKRFRLANSLRKHSLMHDSEDGTFKCELCETSFKLKSYLRKHQKTKSHLQKLAELSST
ncbi:C2H2-type zinc finger protein [Endozoicomonas sp. GU-1]|uniref:C2H2-type zinc finger protein n=1 Tax=Endozoicomonas sp. GU-1 TaxID=3009078 RepID=UPI003FA414FE